MMVMPKTPEEVSLCPPLYMAAKRAEASRAWERGELPVLLLLDVGPHPPDGVSRVRLHTCPDCRRVPLLDVGLQDVVVVVQHRHLDVGLRLPHLERLVGLA